MANRQLTRITVDAGSDGVLNLAAQIPDAINGSGPAITPMPSGPAGYRQSLMDAIRPNDSQAPLESDEVAVVLASSGSTGIPRGILLSGSNLIDACHATDTYLGGPARWVLAIPTHHVGGFQLLVRAHLSGIPVIPLDSVGGRNKFSPIDFMEATELARNVSDADGAPLRVSLVPTQLARILDCGPGAAASLASYDTILLGGAAASPGLIARAKAVGAKVVTTYGMTETTGGCVYDGKPLPGTTIRIVNPDPLGVGQIAISGPTIAHGYRLLPDDTNTVFVDGELLTADNGYLHEDGSLVVTGRSDDVVQVGGISVPVSRVEALVASLPDISEAIVVGISDETWGTKICAIVVAHPDSPLTAGDREEVTVNVVAEQLGPEARPRLVIELDQLPTLPSTKVDRVKLRKLAEQWPGA